MTVKKKRKTFETKNSLFLGLKLRKRSKKESMKKQRR